MLLAQWRPERSERTFLRYAAAHLQPYFPRLLSQSAFNRRARDLAPVLCTLATVIRRHAIEALDLPSPAYELLDGVPVPVMRRCRGIQHRLFRDEAAFGRGGSDREWFYGIKLLTAVDCHGFLSGFVAGPANTEERWLAEALLRWRRYPTMAPPSSDDLAPVLGPTHRAGGRRQGPTGPLGPRSGVGAPSSVPAIADLNYAGEAWNRHWRDHYGAVVLTEAAYQDLAGPQRGRAIRWLHSRRQMVETAIGQLVGRFGLKFPRARTLWGLHTRLGAKMAAYNLTLYLNRLFGRRPFSLCDPLT